MIGLRIVLGILNLTFVIVGAFLLSIDHLSLVNYLICSLNAFAAGFILFGILHDLIKH